MRSSTGITTLSMPDGLCVKPEIQECYARFVQWSFVLRHGPRRLLAPLPRRCDNDSLCHDACDPSVALDL